MKEIFVKISIFIILALGGLFTVKYLISSARNSEIEIQTAKCEAKIQKVLNDAQQKYRELETNNAQKTNNIYSSAPSPIDDIIDLMRQSKM